MPPVVANVLVSAVEIFVATDDAHAKSLLPEHASDIQTSSRKKRSPEDAVKVIVMDVEVASNVAECCPHAPVDNVPEVAPDVILAPVALIVTEHPSVPQSQALYVNSYVVPLVTLIDGVVI